MLSDPEAAIDEGVRLINSGAFFEAHEVLEVAWRGAADPMKQFLKGLIHVAVALYQYERRNEHGARVKYRSAIGYLTPYAPAYAGLDVSALIAEMNHFFKGIETGQEWRPLDYPRPRVRRVHPVS
ncbi:MAG TPA: DUF309 domain-containing protein [Armatimonadota bacterium]|nr:DUF309 domain-containing protein [Armatimonadota bacterium]